MGIAKTIARNTTFGFTAAVSELVIAFVLGIVLARSLGTESYGIYAYLVWFLGIIAVITNLGFGEMTRRFVPEAIGRQSTLEPAGFVQLTLIFRVVAALVVSVVVIISSGYWARMSGGSANQILFIIIALTVWPQVLQMALTNSFKGFQRFEYVLYMSLAMYPLRLILVIVFMALGFGVLEVLIVNITTLALGVLVGFFLLGRLMSLKSLFSPSLLSSDARKRALRYALTLTGVLVLTYLVNNQMVVFFIGLFCPVEEVGFFHLAFRMSSLVKLLPMTLAFTLLPAVAEQFGKGEVEKIKKIYLTSSRYLMIVALPLAVGGIILAESIIILLYGVEYGPTIIIFQVICLPVAIFNIANAGDSVIRGINRPGFILKTLVVFSILKIGLSLWLIPAYGVLGAAIAHAVPLVLTFPVFVIFVSKNIGVAWPVRDTIKIFVASLIMGLAIYALQSQLSVVLSLVLCIPLGVIVYFIAIFALRVIDEQDLAILRGIKYSMPSVLRKHYSFLMRFMERIVVRTKFATGP
jgi:O-antigen/teichoic acid export membrane protein